ncbi:MAG: YtxH domain-containing protein [Bacteroidetes bacterium]|nr:YtxH domain-containing protein [Bacteroidota bacterium]MBS1649365.1 YtxH domain-containing protein [Bacteroidota bacterium]
MKDNQKILTIIILSALAGAGIAYLLSTEKGKILLAELKEKGIKILDEMKEELTAEAKEVVEKIKTCVLETVEKHSTINENSV